MKLHYTKLTTLISIIFIFNSSTGLYIKTTVDNQNLKTQNKNDSKDEWSVFQQKLGLTNQKVKLLKSQKDQQGTLELLNRFIKENLNHKEATPETPNKKSSNKNFFKVYHNIVKQLKLSRSSLKTSLNFEIVDKSKTNLNRPRRKIAVKMVSDLPSQKIDELLKMFNEKYGLNNQDNDKDIDDPDDHGDYSDLAINLPTAMNSDYVYENLYEDEEDLAVPVKTHHNSQYGSIQDLILQASRNQWQHEIEESKLRTRNNEHFI
ncbi:hypothetical protein DOY81_008537 [Sarcophaga bullata]|nr:hypothetical protein DOY81_008537 [Sarcophaga bullata]